MRGRNIDITGEGELNVPQISPKKNKGKTNKTKNIPVTKLPVKEKLWLVDMTRFPVQIIDKEAELVWADCPTHA